MKPRPTLLLLGCALFGASLFTGYRLGSGQGHPGNHTASSLDAPASAVVSEFREREVDSPAEHLARLSLQDLAAKARALAYNPKGTLDEDAQLVLEIYAERDPEGALAMVQDSECWNKARNILATAVFRIAALSGTDAVRALFDQLDHPEGYLNYLRPWAPLLGYAAIAPYFLEFGTTTGTNAEWSATGELFRGWAESDTPGALAAALAISKGAGRDAALLGVMSSWAGKDPAAALAWLDAQDDVQLTLLCGPVLARRAQEIGHELQTELSRRFPSKQSYFDHSKGVPFVSDDPIAEGPAAFSEAAPGAAGQATREGIIARMAARDPAAALALVETLPKGQARSDLIGKLFSIALTEPDSGTEAERRARATGLLASMSDPAERRLAVDRMLQAPWAYFNDMNNGERAAWLIGLPHFDELGPQLANFTHGWGYEDAGAARVWVESLPAGPAREAALHALIPGLARTDPDAALRLSIASVSSKTLLRDVGTWRSAFHGAEAIAWANTLTGSDRDSAMSGALENLAANKRVDVAVAGFDRWLAENPGLAGTENAAHAAGKIAAMWSETAPAATAAWVATLPEGTARAEAADALSRQWLARDPLEASQWIADLPPGASRDVATGHLVEAVYRDDPARALQWAAAIGDPAQRLTGIETSLRFWLRYDSTAAWQALDSAGLAETEIKDLATRLAR